jgi:uncharacterized membrane protein
MWQRLVIFWFYGLAVTLLIVFLTRRIRVKVSKKIRFALLFLVGFIYGFALVVGAWYATPITRPFWTEWKVFTAALIAAIAFALPPPSQWKKRLCRKGLQ